MHVGENAGPPFLLLEPRGEPDEAPMTMYSFSARMDFFDYTQTRFDVGQWL
jgi:hypothetical protein